MKFIFKIPRRIKAIMITIFYEIFSSPKILSKGTLYLDDIKTIDYIINNKLSISRYGVGEIQIISGKNTLPQKYDEGLVKRLVNIISEPIENHISCIPATVAVPFKIQKKNKDKKLKKKVYFYYNRHVYEYKKIYKSLTKNLKILGDSNLSRFYIDYKYSNTNIVDNYLLKLKEIWKLRDIVFVEGKYSRLGVGNDFFNNASSIKRILGPRKDAFDKYDKILESIIKNTTKEKLIILALGVTATILAYDLTKRGYQALDLGNIDVEYEWYKMKAKDKVSLSTKDVTDAAVEDGLMKDDLLNDDTYNNQILDIIE